MLLDKHVHGRDMTCSLWFCGTLLQERLHALQLYLQLGHAYQGRLGVLRVLLQTGGGNSSQTGSSFRDVGKLSLARSIVGIVDLRERSHSTTVKRSAPT